MAVARKLLVAIWHVLSEQEADTNAHIEAVTRKLMNWIAHTGTTQARSEIASYSCMNSLIVLG